eukprot:UN26970
MGGGETKRRKLLPSKQYKFPKTMSPEQKLAMDHIIKGDNLVITGSAGTGKSFIINEVKNYFPSNCTSITACTGVAASHLGGTTINYFCGYRKR